MKSKLLIVIYLAILTIVMSGQMVFASTDNDILISNFDELKTWLEQNETTGGEVILKNDITIKDKYIHMGRDLNKDKKITINANNNSIFLDKSYLWLYENVSVIGNNGSDAIINVNNESELRGIGAVISVISGTAISYDSSHTSTARTDYLKINVKGDDSVGIFSESSLKLIGIQINTDGDNSIAIDCKADVNLVYCNINAKGNEAESVRSDKSVILNTSASFPSIYDASYINSMYLDYVYDVLSNAPGELFIKDRMVVRKTAVEELGLSEWLDIWIKDKDSTVMGERISRVYVDWDTSKYNLDECGEYDIVGKLVLMNPQIKLDMSTYDLRIKVSVVEPIAPTLPEQYKYSYDKRNRIYLDYYFDGCSAEKDVIIYESVDGRDFEISQNAEMNNIDSKPQYPMIYISELQKDHIYKFKLEIKSGVRQGISNILTVNTCEDGLDSGNPGNGDGDDDQENNGSGNDDIGGKRGGSNRYVKNQADLTQEITKKQLQALIKVNKIATLFIVDTVKIVVQTSELEKIKLWDDEKFTITINKLENNKNEIIIKAGSKIITDEIKYTVLESTEAENKHSDFFKTAMEMFENLLNKVLLTSKK